jgi:PAS domain S-box-containing protein
VSTLKKKQAGFAMHARRKPEDKKTPHPEDVFAARQPGRVVRLSNSVSMRWLLGGLAVLATAIAIIAAVCGSRLPSEHGLMAKAAAARHANDVNAAAKQVSYEIRDAESGRQAYRLSGSKADLATYRAEMDDARGAAAELAGLTRDEPNQKDSIGLLQKLLAIDVPQAADNLPLPFNAVRETIASIVEQEDQGLQTRMTAAENAERRELTIVATLSVAPLSIVGLCAAALGVILGTSKNINRAMAERERLLNVMDLAAVIVRDMDGTIRFWSEECERLFGWTAEQAVGQDCQLLLRTEYPEPRAEYEATLAQSGEWFGELRQHTRDGQEAIVLARTILRRGIDGRRMILEMLTDTTALQRSEAALRRSQAILRSVVETAAECILVADEDGKILSINQAGLAMFGYEREADVMGRDVGVLMLPDEAARHQGHMAAWRDGAPPKIIGVPSREMTALRRDGSAFPIDLSVSAFASNGTRFLTGIIRDTTVRKTAEKALRDSEARLRLVQQVGEIANADWTAAGTRAFVSNEYHRLYGLLPGEVAGTFERWLGRVHPDDRTRIAAEARMLNEEPHAVALQFRIRRPDGLVRWISMRAESFREPDGSLRIISGHQDISDLVAGREALAQRRDELERQVAERTAALIAAEEQFRAVFDSQFQFVAVLALDGTVLLANRTALLAGCCDPDDVIGRPFWHTEWWPNVEPHRLRARIAEAAAGVLVRREMELQDPDGHSVWIDLSFKPVVDSLNGQVRQIVAEWRDVTELRELAEKLAQAQKMQALGQLAGGIAHDFNNILQSVSGAAALIERRPDDLERTRRLARSAIDAAARGASITQRLLSFARRGTLRAEVIATDELLYSMREVLAHTLGAGIAVLVEVGDRVPPILADRGQLETALVNLGTNARDAMREGGTLTLSAETTDDGAHPAELAAGHYVRISVADTGCGMTAATFARLAEPFFTTKPTGAGTGLGLAMVKGFAEQSAGAMTVVSEVGLGTTVSLWLARATDAAAFNRVDETVDSPGLPGVTRIMLVDDDDLVRETLAEQMEELGLATIVASSGSEAIALIESGVGLDALVSDLSMPGMGGVATIQKARALRPGLPCFLLTGYVGERAALEAGTAFTLVHKPITGRKLAARIEAALGTAVG